MRSILFLILFGATTGLAAGQSVKRLQPGKLYEPGEKIYAPVYGFTSAIPAEWQGTLPRESEMFLLLPVPPGGGEIFVFGSQNNSIEQIRQNWMRGVALTESILIRVNADEVIAEGNLIMAPVEAVGENINKSYKGYAAARCGEFGACVTTLGIAPVQFFTGLKNGVQGFMKAASFSEPSNVSIYVDFDWGEFLQDKMLITFMAISGGSGAGSKENKVHLCKDGTFTAQLHKKGIMKEDNPAYRGRQTGTWTAEGVGETGTLKLNFKKLPAAEIELVINDEKIFINGERYFAAESDKCD